VYKRLSECHTVFINSASTHLLKKMTFLRYSELFSAIQEIPRPLYVINENTNFWINDGILINNTQKMLEYIQGFNKLNHLRYLSHFPSNLNKSSMYFDLESEKYFGTVRVAI
jgi:hypothetical protein